MFWIITIYFEIMQRPLREDCQHQILRRLVVFWLLLQLAHLRVSHQSQVNLMFQLLLDISKMSAPSKYLRRDPTTSRSWYKKKNAQSKRFALHRKKQKATVETKAESSTPCKITKFSNHPTEENVVWINHNTQIDDAPEKRKLIFRTKKWNFWHGTPNHYTRVGRH